MPLSNTLMSLFGASPFKPLQEHMRVVVRPPKVLQQFREPLLSLTRRCLQIAH